MRSRSAARDRLFAASLGLLSLAVYLPSVGSGVLEADPGEFQLAAPLAGIAHPTGYPLYLILGWAWTRLLPLGSVAYRMNLLSAVFGALAVGLAARLVLRLASQVPWWAAWPAAAAASLVLAFSPTFWSQSLVAEVYTLQVALLMALLLATLAAGPRPDRWWLVALVAGLGLTHHRTTVLYLPACGATLLLTRKDRVHPRHLVGSGLALTAPLFLYTYIPLRAPHTPYLRQWLSPDHALLLYDNSLPSFVGFALGQPFGQSLTIQGLTQRAETALAWAGSELSPLVWLLAVVGLAYLWRVNRTAAVLLAGGLLPNLAFNLVYDIGDVHVLYVPVYALATVMAGAGLAVATHLLRRSYLSPALALIVMASVTRQMPEAHRQAWESVPVPPAERWSAIFQSAPPDAILVSNDRNEIMPMWYHQYVDGTRQDLTGLFPLIVPVPEYGDVGAVVAQALDTGRPVFLIKEMPGLEVAYRLEPRPPLTHVLGRWEASPEVRLDATLSPDLLLLGYDISPRPAISGTGVEIALHWQPLSSLAQPYSSYVHVVDLDGSVSWPGSDHRPGGVFYPATLWKPGEVLRDAHYIHIPEDAPAGTYRLLAGMYVYPSLEPLGQAIDIGLLTVVARPED
mgnify:CR=1 FL=1